MRKPGKGLAPEVRTMSEGVSVRRIRRAAMAAAGTAVAVALAVGWAAAPVGGSGTEAAPALPPASDTGWD